MAGSGKTTFVSTLYQHLVQKLNKKVYTINLDPAVLSCPYPVNIDIKSTLDYKKIMKDYGLGPNGAIMTCLSLFSVRFDQVLDILEKKRNVVDYILVDTPGQIEVFNWSASGSIILDGLSLSFPTTVTYIIDTVRSQKPVTFMSNMLYACSVMYRCKLPFTAVFNKTDVVDFDECAKWMEDYDSFSQAVLLNDDTYMASLSRSCALALAEFYRDLRSVGISSALGSGFPEYLEKLKSAEHEFNTEYKAWIEERRQIIQDKRNIEAEKQWNEISKDLLPKRDSSNLPCIPDHLVEDNQSELDEEYEDQEIRLNPSNRSLL
ncbi:putative XPA-binding protein 1 [Cryptosporidium serpentis]